MRKALQNQLNGERKYKVIGVDDENGILDSLRVLLENSNYEFVGITDPVKAIETVRQEHFDLMLLDFMMTPLHGDEVVEEIRKFNKELYILLLTGHKDLAPPLETIKRLDIQGYCEKSDKFDQLLLLIESGLKSVKQMDEIKKINDELADSKEKLEQAYLDIVQTLRYTVEAKDTYTRGHSDRVAEYSVLIGQKLGLTEEEEDDGITLNQQYLNAVKEGMKSVTSGESGTAYVRFKNFNISVGGKTGSAEAGYDENGNQLVNAWFAAFAPYENPEIVVVVFVENGSHGYYSAEVTKEIMEAYFGLNENIEENKTVKPYIIENN